MYKYYNIMMYKKLRIKKETEKYTAGNWWEIPDRHNEFYSAFMKRDGATYQTSAHLSTNVLYV
jgi:hypothetical protein